MPISDLRFIKNCAERLPKDEFFRIPRGTRGIYALLCKKSENDYDVVYIGMARGVSGVPSRLRKHRNSKRKRDLWTHFSVYEVWDNITEAEIAELEGLFRHIYRRDAKANSINKQRTFKKLERIRRRTSPEDWVAPKHTTGRRRATRRTNKKSAHEKTCSVRDN
jgi:hypothetical protein